MGSMKVSVKWSGQKYDVDAEVAEAPLMFKAQLFALTGVEPGRQKVMLRGKTLGDESWDGFPLKSGAQLMMIGSVGDVPQAPNVKPVFAEDMSAAQLASAMDLPAGLKNLGNTCYMNATVQCLKAVPAIRCALSGFEGNAVQSIGMGTGSKAVTAAVRDLYKLMDDANSRRQQEVAPLLLVTVLHKVFPHFGERDSHGGFQQQDANECWVELVRLLQTELHAPSEGAQAPNSIITQYMGGSLDVTMTNTENTEEPPTNLTEDFLQLSCFLSQDVKYLQSGLRAKLVEEVEKMSTSLDKNCIYKRESLISRLPAYLTVQMVRFFYKEKDKVNAKILKDVKFALSLDMYEFCTEQLKQKLTPMRKKFAEEDDRIALTKAAKKTDGKPSGDKGEECEKEMMPFSFEEDPGSNNSAYYELQAVLTHKGRSSSSGHYVAWVKRGPNSWLMCDDDNITNVQDEDIIKLSGGGDWHCAYVLLFGPRQLPVYVPESETPME